MQYTKQQADELALSTSAIRKQQINDLRMNLSIGDIIIACRPMPTDSGSMKWKDVRAKVIGKYDSYCLVEDAEEFKELSPWGTNKRKWSVRYEDIISSRIRKDQRNVGDIFE